MSSFDLMVIIYFLLVLSFDGYNLAFVIGAFLMIERSEHLQKSFQKLVPKSLSFLSC